MKKAVFIPLLILSMFQLSCKKDHDNQEPDDNAILISPISWKLSGTPLAYRDTVDSISFKDNYNRAHIAWYVIDPLFYGDSRPSYITNGDLSTNNTRQVRASEFLGNDNSSVVPILEVHFYPNEKGQYNYETEKTDVSKGIDNNGYLLEPNTRWGGIQACIINDLLNYSSLQFWMMDPFLDQNSSTGKLYINIGEIDERIYNNRLIAGTNANKFGLDYMNDPDENYFFSPYLDKLQMRLTNFEMLNRFISDPSQDNYVNFKNPKYDDHQSSIFDRYKYVNGYEGNSVDSEDINKDNKIDTTNKYDEFYISINKDDFRKGFNHVDSVVEKKIRLKDGTETLTRWYHFKIDLINNYPNKMIRIYFSDFNDDMHFRFYNMALYKE